MISLVIGGGVSYLLGRGFRTCHFCWVQMLPKFTTGLCQLQLEQASAQGFKISVLDIQRCTATFCNEVSSSFVCIGFWCCICRRELTYASKSVLNSPAGVSFSGEAQPGMMLWTFPIPECLPALWVWRVSVSLSVTPTDFTGTTWRVSICRGCKLRPIEFVVVLTTTPGIYWFLIEMFLRILSVLFRERKIFMNQPDWVGMVLWEIHKRILFPENQTAVCQAILFFLVDLGV